MGNNSYRNYTGPSQEYSPGDIDPVSNHVVLDVNGYGNITKRDTGPGGTLTGWAVDRFGQYADDKNLESYYGYLQSFGSDYGKIGFGYHSVPQSWLGYLSDQYSALVSDGKFSTDSPIYEKVALDIMGAHYASMVQGNTIPNTQEIFNLHEKVFACHGLDGAWIGSGLLGPAVDLFMGEEPSDGYSSFGPLNTLAERERLEKACKLGDTGDGPERAYNMNRANSSASSTSQYGEGALCWKSRIKWASKHSEKIMQLG